MGESLSSFANASRAVSPVPLSVTPGPRIVPSGSTRMSSGRAGARIVSMCAVTAMYGSCFD